MRPSRSSTRLAVPAFPDSCRHDPKAIVDAGTAAEMQ
jgi:hypothetical protein